MVYKKALLSKQQSETYNFNLRKGILQDRFEILKLIQTKYPNVELNVSTNYFDQILKQCVRNNDSDTNPNKINAAEGFGMETKINGDFSYNMSVIEK